MEIISFPDLYPSMTNKYGCSDLSETDIVFVMNLEFKKDSYSFQSHYKALWEPQ